MDLRDVRKMSSFFKNNNPGLKRKSVLLKTKMTDIEDGQVVDDIIHKALNMDYSSLTNYYMNFDRYYSIYNELEQTDQLRSYVFIVRPDLNLFNELNPLSPSLCCSNDSFVRMMIDQYNIVTRQLTDTLTNEHHFMTFPTSRVESIQIPDYSIKTYSLSQPYTNILLQYGGNAWESQTGGTFDIVFREDVNFRIHKLFQLWLYYIDAVTRNVFEPKLKYVLYNKLDYACSIYYIACAQDASTILWWSKYTGALPTNVPNSDLSFNLRGSVDNKVTIPFAYFMNEPLNPEILVDFNYNANYTSGDNFIPNYDPDLASTGKALVGVPYITWGPTAYGKAYKLKWRESTIGQ